MNNEEACEFFKLFSVKTRIEIVELLKKEQKLGAKEIAQKLNLTVAAVSQHLKLLKSKGLVDKKREGFFIPYKLNHAAMSKCNLMFQKVCHCNHHAQGGHLSLGLKTGCEALDNLSLKDLLEYKQKLLKHLEQVELKINGFEDKI